MADAETLVVAVTLFGGLYLMFGKAIISLINWLSPRFSGSNGEVEVVSGIQYE